MQAPCVEDFMMCFGMRPVEEDPEERYYSYTIKSNDGNSEIDFSFNEISNSFHMILRCLGKETGKIFSEKVQKIEILKEKHRSGIHVIFEISRWMAKLDIIFEPDLYHYWWMLKTECD